MSMQLFNDDCLQKLKDLSSNSVDLIICDLPYGCLSNGAKKEKMTSGCPWDVKIDLDLFWKEIKRIRRNEHTPTLHFTTTTYGFELYNSNPKEFRYDLIWSKTNAVGFLKANKMPLRGHENIYIFSKAGAYYNRIDISGDFPFAGGGRSNNNVYGEKCENIQPNNKGKRCVKSIIECANKKTKGGHPTAKPVELYKFLIERYCPVGGTVLDPTFGSGNSGIASKELKRNYIGIEKDKVFYEKAKKRLEV